MNVICIESIYCKCSFIEGERYIRLIGIDGKFKIHNINEMVVYVVEKFDKPKFIEVIENCLTIWKKEEL